MYRKILIPMDGSKDAEAVLPYAKELAARLGVEVVLLHVVRPEERGLFEPLHRAYVNETVEAIRRQAREAQLKVQPDSTPVPVHGDIVVGYPDEEILRFAAAEAADLILMATNDSTGSRRRTLGRVAEKVPRQSRIPVWLVRAGVPDAV